MPDNEAGAFLNITPDVLKKLDSFDEKLEKIEKHAHTAADALKNGFGSVVVDTSKLESAITSLANKIGALNTAGRAVGNIGTSMNEVSKDATRAASSLSSVAQTLNRVKPDNGLAKSVEQYRNISAQIEQISSRQKQLNDIVKSYELTMSRIQSGKGGVIQAGQQQQVQSARQELEANNQLLATLRQKQQEIVNTNKAYQQQVQLAQQLRNLEQERNSLPNQRSKQTLADMRAYYSELEKSSARAAKAAEQAAERESRADEKRYNEWLRRKAHEEKEALRISNAKAKAEEQAMRASLLSYRNTPQGALDYSKNAKSLRDQVTAINYLKQARLSLNTTDKNYQSTLQQINLAISRHNQALQQAGVQSQSLARNHRNLMDTAGQLSRQLALVFSVSQIEGYIRKIVEVRGQFELQQVALRAILQDKDKADKIFSQTMQQALKSPFQAMQLVTFTKQLAAYRIESDKLFDTTKRLADVSAGLGVDIQRLILAYGQVKAAAYLRGTEVRQFTEAGINLYGELQSYFEEVKGEAYTTAQIVDMISKRMVKFEDVEAVFQRMTDKGGLFYNMQEVQVNTLHGQINRLKDVISIMQNEIGKSNQEGFLSISTAINLANTLLENWRTVASVLKTIITAYGTFKTVSGAMWIAERIYMTKGIAMQKTRISLKFKEIMATRTQTAATVGATAAQNGLNMAVAKNPYGAILAVITAVGVAIYEVIQNTNRLKEALDGIAAEGAFSVVQSSNNYVKLASVVTDSTKSYQEHNKALAELKKKYSDILPEQYLNAEGIKALNGNYNEAIKLIHQYINAKTKERMIDEVGQDANKEMYSNQQKTAKTISEIIDEQHGMKVSWSEISGVLSQVQEKLLSGAIKSTRQLREETEKVVEQYTGLGNIDLSDYFTQLSGSSFGGADKFRFDTIQIERSQFRDWFESARSYISQVESIEQRFSKGSISMTAQRYQEQKDAAEKMVANAMNAYDVLRDSQKKNTKVTKEELEHARALVQKVLKAIGSDVQVDSTYINKLFNDSFFFEEEKQKAIQTKLKQLFDKLTKEAKESGDTSGAVWLQEFEKQINGLNLNPLQNSIKKFLLGINGNADIQANWNIRSGETEAEFKKRIKTEIDTRNEIIRKSQSTIYPEYGQDTNKVKSELEELNRLYNKLGGDKNKSRSSAERDIWAERISVLKEMQSRYEKLNQLMGENAAIEQTLSAFKPALEFTGMDKMNILPTKEGMIKAYEELLKDVTDSKKITELKKIIAELKIEIQQEDLKNQLETTKKNIEDLFNGLDLHKKLKDAGLSEAEVQQLFPGLAKTLDDVQKGIEIEFQTKYGDTYKDPNTQQYKDYQDAIKKLEQQRIKESQDLVIELTKNYKSQLTDRLQLDRWYYEERAKIQRAKLTDEQKTLYESNLTSQYNKKSDENTWKQFQNSDMYISMFENIEGASTRMLTAMRDKLMSLRENLKDLPADQLKAIINQQEKIDEMIAKKNPFIGLTSGVKEYIQFLKERKELEEENIRANNAVDYYTSLSNEQSKIVEQKRQEYNAAVATSGILSKEARQLSVQLETEKSKLDIILKQLTAEKKISKETAEQIRNGQNLGDTLKNKIGESGRIFSEFSSALPQIASDLENVFGSMSDGTKDVINRTAEAAGGIAQIATGIAQGPVGYLQAAMGLAKTVSALFGSDDARLQKEIEGHERKIKKLEREYDKLKESIDNVWDITKLQEYGNELDENINKQIVSLNAMIAAERDKKDTDWDKINEWQEQIEDLRDTLADSANDMIAELGGVGSDENFKTLAENFASAWLEAFQETGDGLSGLQESFDDFMENYVKQQILLRLSDKFLKPMFDEFDSLIATRTDMEQEDQERYFELQAQITRLRNTANNSVIKSVAKKANAAADEIENSEEYKRLQKAYTDFLKPNDINTEAIKDWSDKMKEVFGEYNEAAEEIFNQIGWEPGGKANLSALTQSIQGITETTAEALEALLNSIRFFVSQQTTDITAIRNLLDARYSLESQAETNPMLIELKAQTGYLEIISDRIDRVFAPNSNSRGAGLRVFISD